MLAIVNAIFLFILGLLFANAGEWVMHKYFLHGLGMQKNSFWAYHWYEHYRVCTQNHMYDPGYQKLRLQWNAQTRELLVLVVIALVQLPLMTIAGWFVAGVYWSIIFYYYRHRKAHLNPAWARQHMPWHYEHHLGKNASSNWCITWPWFDYIMGTRGKSGTNDS
jgi:hypothetical protein